MAYTQNIDEATPAGTDNANTADDQLRALKRDIKERLNSFFTDYNSDPLIPKNYAQIQNLTVKTGQTEFALTMSQGLIGSTNILFVDKTAQNIARIILGYAGGNVNWAWTILPAEDPTYMPAYNSNLNGLVAVDSVNNRLVFYIGGARRYIVADGTF